MRGNQEKNLNPQQQEIIDQISDLHTSINLTEATFPLYHYTTIEGLQGILSNASFHVSKSDFLNDRTEIVYFNGVFEEVIFSLKDDFDGEADKLDFARFCDSFKLKDHDALFEKDYDLFVLSLSKTPDNLSIWSNYTNGTGYNLGFNKCLVDSLSCNKQNPIFWCFDVIYDKEVQKNFIQNELLSAYNLWLKYKANQQDLDPFLAANSYGDKILDGLFYKLKVYAMFFKDSAFSSEDEARIVILTPTYANLRIYDERVYGKIKFKVRNGVFIPYIEASFLKDCIDYVGIGPKNTMDIAKTGLKLFLRNHDYFQNIEIRASSIPLRF